MTTTAARPATAVVARKDVVTTLVSTVERYADKLERLAPRGIDAAFMIASLELYFAENPKLLECTPVSVVKGMLRVAQTGLTLGVSCDLLPFGKVCQFSPRYTGIIELALLSGVRSVQKGVVREGDVFAYDLGTSLFLRHEKVAKSTAPITHAYAHAQIKAGASAMEVMLREEIDAHRAQYSKQWWKDARGRVIPLEACAWYGPKTCVRRLSAVMPKNPRLVAALMFEKEVEAEPKEEIPEGEFEVEGETRAADEASGESGPAYGGPRESEEFIDDSDLLP